MDHVFFVHTDRLLAGSSRILYILGASDTSAVYSMQN